MMTQSSSPTPSDKNHHRRRPKVREVPSRFMSPSPSDPSPRERFESSLLRSSMNNIFPLLSSSNNLPPTITTSHRINEPPRTQQLHHKENRSFNLNSISHLNTNISPKTNHHHQDVTLLRSSLPHCSHLKVTPYNRSLKGSFQSVAATPCALHQQQHCSGSMVNVLEVIKTSEKSKHLLQDDVHCLRMMHNAYLQWSFANAKQQSALSAQQHRAEASLHAMSMKISELRSSVERKGLELMELKQMDTLYNVLESQIPHLEEWYGVEDDYLTSLSGLTKALQNALLRIPVNEHVRVDIEEIDVTLNLASSVMKNMALHVISFLPKAEEISKLTSELAGVLNAEKSSLKECGALLETRNAIQAEECSLRSQILQLKQSSAT